MFKRSVLVLAGIALLISGAAFAEKGDPAAGKAKSATCVACHGANGISAVPTWPNLAGQKEQYLVLSLKAYRAGERTNANAATMRPMAAGLSDQDILDLAAYYASLGN